MTGPHAQAAPPNRGALRAARVLVLAAAALLLAVGGHLAGGGSTPGPEQLLLAGVVAGSGAVLLTARRARLPVLLLGLVAEQAALHLAFGGTAGAGMAHHAGTAGSGSSVLGTGMSAAMLAGHLVATVLTALLLARGEAWLWDLGERAARAARATVTPFVVPARSALVAPVLVRVTAGPQRRTSSRGPPASCG